MIRRLIPLALTGAMAATALAAPGQALAINPVQAQVVSAVAANTTPQVQDGEVMAVAVVGNSVVIGGNFTQIGDTAGGNIQPRKYLAAFDATTGALSTTFQPTVDDIVTSLVAGPNNTVYVGGKFDNVNGNAQRGLARLNVADGSRTSGFTGFVGNNTGQAGGGNVDTLALRGSTLYVGGRFNTVRGVARDALAAVDATTGQTLPFNVVVAGHRTAVPATPGVQTLDITADGTTMVIGGNFLTVGGLPREQVAVIDLTTGSVTGWQTSDFHPAAAGGNNSYLNQVGISPDGTYFVAVTTGGKTDNSLCDAAARFELGSKTSGLHPTWVDYTGGDTLTSVAVTGAAVYVAGHPRWFNNFLGNGSQDISAVPRQTIAALDPVSGQPLPWKPTMARPGPGNTSEGPKALLATSQGLWVGWDSDTVGGVPHERIAFFPLAGGTTPPSTTPTTLPGKVVIAGPGNTLTTRTISSDGATYGAATPVATPGAVDWSKIVGGALAGGQILYVSTTDNSLNAVPFDGSTVGSSVQIVSPPNVPLSTITSMTYSSGRLYFTTGDGKLHYRYFLPSTDIIGTQDLLASTSSFGVFPDTTQMFIGQGALYANHAGSLYRIPMSNGIISGGATLVSGDHSWTGTAAMLSSTPRAVVAPAAQHDFTGDGHGDLLGRDTGGTLWIYQGNNAGSFTSRSSLGTGWNAMTAILTTGDFDGDGRADIIARDAAGRLWLYPGKAPATLSPRRQIGIGWQTMTAIVGVGDMDGDGLPDLVARDPKGVLWLYSGNGRDAFPHKTSLGPGWNVMTAITASGPLGGQNGLLARQSNGVLWLYKGNGHGGYSSKVSFGTGWNAMNALAGNVFLNNDGNPDLLARETATGKLWLYPGTAGGNISAKSQAGTGWNIINLIA